MMSFNLCRRAAFSFLIVLSMKAAEMPLWRSGPEQVALLELYTSEGCSSCPPAEKWLSKLTDSSALWRDIVPVEFHVDYWDYLGWVDRFSSAENTERQQRYAATWRSGSVYTPAFVLDGREWRNWAGLRGFPEGERQRTGVLEVQRAGTNAVVVHYAPDPKNVRTGPIEAHVAWLGSGIVSSVRRGENAGYELRHPFVMLRLLTVPLDDHPNTGRTRIELPRLPESGSSHLGLAVWVSRVGNPAPEQAVGGWWNPGLVVNSRR